MRALSGPVPYPEYAVPKSKLSSDPGVTTSSSPAKLAGRKAFLIFRQNLLCFGGGASPGTQETYLLFSG
jgi:hypothetical protein